MIGDEETPLDEGSPIVLECEDCGTSAETIIRADRSFFWQCPICDCEVEFPGPELAGFH